MHRGLLSSLGVNIFINFGELSLKCSAVCSGENNMGKLLLITALFVPFTKTGIQVTHDVMKQDEQCIGKGHVTLWANTALVRLRYVPQRCVI